MTVTVRDLIEMLGAYRENAFVCLQVDGEDSFFRNIECVKYGKCKYYTLILRGSNLEDDRNFLEEDKIRDNRG